MRIVEVTGKKEKSEFSAFPKHLYREDPCWVCPLDSGLEGIFDPSLNHAFEHGRAIRWILKDHDDVTIGRVAAFIDDHRSGANRQPTGGMGFFEVIEDRDAAFMLFDTARDWLASQGIEAMDGPINFGENDNNWGLLVDGFVRPGFGMPYNKKYYRDYFEEYGFRVYFEQYSYHREIRDESGNFTTFPERMMKIAGWLSKRPGYSFRHFEIRNRRKYMNDIVEIYNAAWSLFKEDFTPLNPVFLEESFMKARPIIDEDLIWFAYFNDKPIAFFVLFPDLNQILVRLNGKMDLLNMIKFGWYKMNHRMTRLRAVVGGVHPSYQNSGVESAIFLQLYNEFRRKPWFKELELSWVGDFNPRMMAIYEALGARKAKTHHTYRYMINKKLPFIMYKDELAETFGHEKAGSMS
jgi:ribosomal protein S18 acetylase RimI-like enzyme